MTGARRRGLAIAGLLWLSGALTGALIALVIVAAVVLHA